MDNFVGDKRLIDNNFDRRRNTGNIPQTVKNSPDKFGFDNLNKSDIETVPKISKFNSAVLNKKSNQNKSVYLKSMRENRKKNEF